MASLHLCPIDVYPIKMVLYNVAWKEIQLNAAHVT